MALTEESNGIPATMLVGPASMGGTPYPVYSNMGGGNNCGFGGDGGW